MFPVKGGQYDREKINGYKDDSFFTPGFITMYMCRETIRRTIFQKFEEIKGWKCESIDQLKDKIENRTEANAIVNSLKICNPAVGSGHFLVSAGSASEIGNKIENFINGDLVAHEVEREIDQLVYQLYNLTDEEIEIVESSFSG